MKKKVVRIFEQGGSEYTRFMEELSKFHSGKTNETAISNILTLISTLGSYVKLAKHQTFFQWVEQFFVINIKNSESEHSNVENSFVKLLISLFNSGTFNQIEYLTENLIIPIFKEKKTSWMGHETVKGITSGDTLGQVVKVLARNQNEDSKKSVLEHKEYIFNLLQIVRYRRECSRSILEHVINSAIELDLQIRLEVEDDGSELEEEDDDQNPVLFHLELEDGENLSVEQKRILRAEKLDATMGELFKYFKKNPRSFVTLMRLFFAQILQTTKLNCTQFVVFYACSLRKEFPPRFISELLKWIGINKRPELPDAVTTCCIAYLASFLARANYISPQLVTDTTLKMLKFCEINMKKRKSMFIKMLQAISYVVCFRSNEMVNFNWKKLQDLLLDKRIKPLSVFPNDVADVLTRVFKKFGMKIPREYTMLDNSNGVELGNLYFPFDPYVLQRSRMFIEPLFVTFKEDSFPSPSPQMSSFDERAFDNSIMDIGDDNVELVDLNEDDEDDDDFNTFFFRDGSKEDEVNEFEGEFSSSLKDVFTMFNE